MASDVLVDPETGKIDTERILAEAIRIAKLKLIALVVAVAAIPIILMLALEPLGLFGIGWLPTLLSAFLLAVGGVVVLLYVIVGGLELADER